MTAEERQKFVKIATNACALSVKDLVDPTPRTLLLGIYTTKGPCGQINELTLHVYADHEGQLTLLLHRGYDLYVARTARYICFKPELAFEDDAVNWPRLKHLSAKHCDFEFCSLLEKQGFDVGPLLQDTKIPAYEEAYKKVYTVSVEQATPQDICANTKY